MAATPKSDDFLHIAYNNSNDRMYSWTTIIPMILKAPPHQDMVISKDIVPHPLRERFRQAIGDIQLPPQKGGYELTLENGKRIHIREFENVYKVHWDKFSPAVNVIEHLRHDAPHWWVFLCGSVGSALGYVFSKGKAEGAIAGGGLGVAFGLATLPGE